MGKQGGVHPYALRQEGYIQDPVIQEELLQVQVEPQMLGSDLVTGIFIIQIQGLQQQAIEAGDIGWG